MVFSRELFRILAPPAHSPAQPFTPFPARGYHSNKLSPTHIHPLNGTARVLFLPPPLVMVLSLLLFSHAYSLHQLNHPANQSPILFSHGIVVTLSHSHRSAHLAFYILIVPPTTDSLSPLPSPNHLQFRDSDTRIFPHTLIDLIFISSACNRLPAHSPRTH